MHVTPEIVKIINIELRGDEIGDFRSEINAMEFTNEDSPLVYKLWFELGKLI